MATRNRDMQGFECEECEYEWEAIPNATGHAWETCPNCGTDDGENCWDCGESTEDDAFNLCTGCHRTLCWDCQHRHLEGRQADKGHCGETARVL
jgi:hypothetical protein